MKIAIIGTGISGLSCAFALQKDFDIHVFERAERIGGHTATVDVNHEGETFAIDTGFIVFNDWTYPKFISLLSGLGVESQASDMSFSVSSQASNIEYAGTNLNALFAQRKNILNPTYWRMLKDILRFNREAVEDLQTGAIDDKTLLGNYLQERGYSEAFKRWYLIPMGSAIWSSSLNEMMAFPLKFFVAFFKNHGLLNVMDRPQWRVIKGGSSSYLGPLTEGFKDRIRLNCQITRIVRRQNGARLEFAGAGYEDFDAVVFACHADTVLSLLADPSEDELSILSALPYRSNRVVLHTDESLLPVNKRAWASWNYLLDNDPSRAPTLSYNMNMLQGIKSNSTFIVTLNAEDKIDPAKIIRCFDYEHPVFTHAGVAAQNRKQVIDGKRNTWFCGAYWKNGFHEDGCVSGLNVAEDIQKRLGNFKACA